MILSFCGASQSTQNMKAVWNLEHITIYTIWFIYHCFWIIIIGINWTYICIYLYLYMHMHIYVKSVFELSDSWLFWNMHYWTFNLWWKWQSSLTRRLTRNVIIASKKQNFNLLLNLRFKINWEDANEIVYRLIRSFKF